MSPADLDYCLRMGLADLVTFNCGRRPLIRNAMQLYGIIHQRFDYFGYLNRITIAREIATDRFNRYLNRAANNR